MSDENRFINSIRKIKALTTVIKSTYKDDTDEFYFADDIEIRTDSLIRDMFSYVEDIYQIQMLKKKIGSIETKEYGDEMTRLDRSRRDNHNGLIDDIIFLDSNLGKINLSPIYGGIPKEYRDNPKKLEENIGDKKADRIRTEVTEWAKNVVNGCTIIFFMDRYEKEKMDSYYGLEYEQTLAEKYMKEMGGGRGKRYVFDLTTPNEEDIEDAKKIIKGLEK